MAALDINQLKKIRKNADLFLRKNGNSSKAGKVSRLRSDLDRYIKMHDTDEAGKPVVNAIKSLEKSLQKQLASIWDSKQVGQMVAESHSKVMEGIVGQMPQMKPLVETVKTSVEDMGNRLETKLGDLKPESNSEIIKALTRLETTIKKSSNEKKLISEIQELGNSLDKLFNKETPTPTPIDLSALESKLDSLNQSIQKLPTRYPEYPKSEVIVDTESIVEGLGELKESLSSLKMPEVNIPETVQVTNWPKFPVPNPVTNININPLRGLVHSSTTTVTTELTTLPGYGVLSGRRAVIFYNNSSTVTVFIGGSDVTVAEGLPLEPKSYSPSFDSGPNQIWYGITSSGSADVRAIEIQNDSGA